MKDNPNPDNYIWYSNNSYTKEWIMLDAHAPVFSCSFVYWTLVISNCDQNKETHEQLKLRN